MTAPVETKIAAIVVKVPTIMGEIAAVKLPVIPDIGAVVADIVAVMTNVLAVVTGIATIIKTALGLSAYGEEEAGGKEYGQFLFHFRRF